MKKPNPNYTPPASVGCETPEYRRATEPPKPKPAERANEYITISVAEYVFLVKAATLLEVIANDPTYDGKALDAVKATVKEMLCFEKVGAEQ